MNVVEVNVHRYIYGCVCMHMHICTCVILCVWMHMLAPLSDDTYVWSHKCVYIDAQACIFVYVFMQSACIHASYICECMFLHLYVCELYVFVVIGNTLSPIHNFSRQKLQW